MADISITERINVKGNNGGKQKIYQGWHPRFRTTQQANFRNTQTINHQETQIIQWVALIGAFKQAEGALARWVQA